MKSARSGNRIRDTLLEDYIGKIVVCHLQSGAVRGRLLRVARYEIELDAGGRLVVVFKHAITHVSILNSPRSSRFLPLG